MSSIALLTDFGLKDNFVGVMKGVILSFHPQARIVDICHEIRPQNILEAAFSFKTAYSFFPKGTIFVVVVDPTVGSARFPLLIKTRHYYFIAPDNGVLSFALDDEDVEGIICLDNEEFHLKHVSSTFHGRDVFSPVAAHLSAGVDFRRFGTPITNYKKIDFPRPKKKKKQIKASVLCVDRFGNLITNIDESLHDELQHCRIKIKNVTISEIKKAYSNARPKEFIAMWGSSGFLEIARNLSSAARKLAVKAGERITIIPSR